MLLLLQQILWRRRLNRLLHIAFYRPIFHLNNHRGTREGANSQSKITKREEKSEISRTKTYRENIGRKIKYLLIPLLEGDRETF